MVQSTNMNQQQHTLTQDAGLSQLEDARLFWLESVKKQCQLNQQFQQALEAGQLNELQFKATQEQKQQHLKIVEKQIALQQLKIQKLVQALKDLDAEQQRQLQQQQILERQNAIPQDSEIRHEVLENEDTDIMDSKEDNDVANTSDRSPSSTSSRNSSSISKIDDYSESENETDGDLSEFEGEPKPSKVHLLVNFMRRLFLSPHEETNDEGMSLENEMQRDNTSSPNHVGYKEREKKNVSLYDMYTIFVFFLFLFLLFGPMIQSNIYTQKDVHYAIKNETDALKTEIMEDFQKEYSRLNFNLTALLERVDTIEKALVKISESINCNKLKKTVNERNNDLGFVHFLIMVIMVVTIVIVYSIPKH